MTVKHKCGLVLQALELWQNNSVGTIKRWVYFHRGIKIEYSTDGKHQICPKCKQNIIKADCLPPVRFVEPVADTSFVENGNKNLNVIKL